MSFWVLLGYFCFDLVFGFLVLGFCFLVFWGVFVCFLNSIRRCAMCRYKDKYCICTVDSAQIHIFATVNLLSPQNN